MSLGLPAPAAQSHDPGAWGGLFRSRDFGATWDTANRGIYLNGALALAVSPADSNHLLLGTETGLLRSRNSGRDWQIEAPSTLRGSIFCAIFDHTGQQSLVASSQGLVLDRGDNNWRPLPTPARAIPVRALARGDAPGRIYLAGWNGFYRSDDWGGSWLDASAGLPGGPVIALLAVPGTPERLYAAVDRRLCVSTDAARSWTALVEVDAAAQIEAFTQADGDPDALWASAAGRFYYSRDSGRSWTAASGQLPEKGTTVHRIAADGRTLLVTSTRGIYRSVDGGENWTAVVDNIPAHLEAGPLLADPADPTCLYAGFSMIPYSALWRRAASDDGDLLQAGPAGLVGSVATILLLGGAGVGLFFRLKRHYPVTTPLRQSRTHKVGEEVP